MPTAYAFSNTAPEAPTQLDSLQTFLDPITIGRLAELGLAPGSCCWEIGAGAGSIAAWLAYHAGPSGSVTATDIDTSRLDHLADLVNVSVLTHDVTDLTSPPGGPYDLIHARLVLLHLPEREAVLAALIAALKPGGHLLIEEFDCTDTLFVLETSDPDDAELFVRVTDAIVDTLEEAGADMAWARRVYAAMTHNHLRDVHARTITETWPGGSVGARLHQVNTHQLRQQLLNTGLTDADLDRFRALLEDPTFVAESYRFVSTRGQLSP